VLALLSGGLQILVFPRFSFYFLCWIALVPLLYALIRGRGGEGELLDCEGRSLRPLNLKQGFLLGWLCGSVWYIGTVFWVYGVMYTYGHLDRPVAMLIMLGFCMIMGLHQGVFGLLTVFTVRRSTAGNARPLLLAPFFWTAIEFLHDRFSGFAWDPLGNAQINNIPFSRIAEYTGVYGLSFAIVLVNCAFTAGLLLFGKRRKNLLVSAAAAAVALQMGVFAKAGPFETTKVAVLVQPNIPVLDEAWSPAFFDQTLAQLSQVSVSATPKNPPGNPGLIIWPESPSPFYVDDPNFLHWLSAIAQDTNSYLIIGSTGKQQKPGQNPQPLNSALFIDPQGRIMGRYDKIHLVPFGEYVPLRDLLFFVSKLTSEVGDFGRGTERKVFELNGTKAGAFICYESVFPDEVREFAANGAQVFINISDDTWYGYTGEMQHLDMARMRAIENHRWILLSTNSGTTAAIDPYGRVVGRAPRNARTALVAAYTPLSDTTFYSRNGDLFGWICVVISLLGIFLRFRMSARTMIEARST
jgi:apolipoprotein N-acyltransferase